MIDLCPLVSMIDKGALREVLNNMEIVSGNEQEYKDLIQKLGIADTNDLLRNYPNIKYMFIKRGGQGADCKSRNETENCSFQYYGINSLETVNTTGCGDVFNAIIIEGCCLGEKCQSILHRAVTESGKIDKGGLPWIRK